MAVVYEKGIVVLPKRIREESGIHTGSKIIYKTRKNKIIIEHEKDWEQEHEKLREEISKASGKDLSKRIKIAEEKYKNRFKHVH